MVDGNIPTVGVPSDEYRAVCLYSRQPGDPQCGDTATLHVIVTSDVPTATNGLAALPTCDTHAPIARAAGGFVAEHEHAGVCGLPGAIWLSDRNECVIDDSGVEPTYYFPPGCICYVREDPDWGEVYTRPNGQPCPAHDGAPLAADLKTESIEGGA